MLADWDALPGYKWAMLAGGYKIRFRANSGRLARPSRDAANFAATALISLLSMDDFLRLR